MPPLRSLAVCSGGNSARGTQSIVSNEIYLGKCHVFVYYNCGEEEASYVAPQLATSQDREPHRQASR
jgi:hypothetical protein